MLLFTLALAFGTTNLPTDLREEMFNTLNPVFQKRYNRIRSHSNFSIFQRNCMTPFVTRKRDIDYESVCEGINLLLFVTTGTKTITPPISNLLIRVINFYLQNPAIDSEIKEQFEEFCEILYRYNNNIGKNDL